MSCIVKFFIEREVFWGYVNKVVWFYIFEKEREREDYFIIYVGKE